VTVHYHSRTLRAAARHSRVPNVRWWPIPLKKSASRICPKYSVVPALAVALMIQLRRSD
jgi:hypothetical protein